MSDEPREMTPDALRDVAWTLDSLVKLTRCLLEPIAHGGAAGAAEVTVTCDVTSKGEPMPAADAQKLLDWVTDDEMQDDLRAWANDIAAHRLRTTP